MLEMRKEVETLKARVDHELTTGFQGDGTLGKQLQRLEIHNEKRRIHKMSQREEQFKSRLKLKKQLLEELQTAIDFDSISNASFISSSIEDITSEEISSLNMMSQVLIRNQGELFSQLQEWFKIERCDDNPLFPYTIWHLPLINIKNSNRMDRETMSSSMGYLRQYVSLALKIWLFDTQDSPNEDQDVVMQCSRLVYDILQLLQARKLVSNSVSIRDILVRYDLDGMVYHLYQNSFLKSLEDTSNSYPPTLANISDLIRTIIPSS